MKNDPFELLKARERHKAVREAWKREQLLVWEGKGTKKQQIDILDLKKGKAYDDFGQAFEGQHMKSAAEYPEYLGNPDNIQFLTRDEHLMAHKGNWRNPTNWYYDPLTRAYSNFANDQLIPCKIIELSDPVIADGLIDFYVIDPLTGKKIKPGDVVLNCEEGEVIRRINEGRFVKLSELAIAITYAHFKLSNTRITTESFKQTVAEAGDTVNYCLAPDAIAIPLKTKETYDYYYAVSDIDFNRLEERLTHSEVNQLRTKLEGIDDINALSAERKSVITDIRKFIKSQNITDTDLEKINRFISTLYRISFSAFYNTMNQHEGLYTNERLAVNRNSALTFPKNIP